MSFNLQFPENLAMNLINPLVGPIIDRLYAYRTKLLLLKQAQEAELFYALQQRAEKAVQLVNLKAKVEPPKIDATQEELEQSYGAGVWIYAAINVIAEKSASIPWRVVDRNREDIPSPLPIRPNPLMSWNHLRQCLQISLDTTGNGFIFWDNESNQFWLLRTSRVRIVPGPDGRSILGYAYKSEAAFKPAQTVQGRLWTLRQDEAMYISRKEFDEHIHKTKAWLTRGDVSEKMSIAGGEAWLPIEPENMIHVRYAHSYNSWYGMSPLQPLLISFITEMHARKWNQLFFENGALPPGVLVFPETLQPAQYKAISEQFKEKHQGIKNAWMPFIAQGGATFTPFPNQHKDLDFLNLLRWTRDETLAVLNVPPAMVMAFAGMDGSTRSLGIAEQRQIFWKDTIIPKEENKVEQFTIDLESLLGAGNSIIIDTSTIEELQPNWTELAKAGKDLIISGMSVQEVREKVYGLTDLPKDPIYLPMGLAPVDLANPVSVQSYYLYQRPMQPIEAGYASYPYAQQIASHRKELPSADEAETEAD